MSVKLVLAKAHQEQLKDEFVKQEFNSIQTGLNSIDIQYQDGTINFVFIKGIYDDFEKKMITAFVLVNKLEQPVKEIHGKIGLQFRNVDALIATATIDFDEPFMGTLEPEEGLLVHLNFPVKGLDHDQEFSFQDIAGQFDDVRITYA